MDIDVGTVIAGRYELVRLVGKGAMGEVWLATHNTLGGEFAIKLVETSDDYEAESASGRFQLEAQIAAKLSRRTRHIVSVSDHGEEDGFAYLVMELLVGESLESRLKRGPPLDLPEAAALVLQVSRALALAHGEGIFHRDLKPANVYLTRDEDEQLIVKLLDFGIARAAKAFRTRSPFMTSKDMVLGTPSYMSPEQARGLDTLDHRCDLWALATVAYESLTKKIPFEGDTVEDVFLSICTFRVVPIHARRADLPPGLADFFGRAFAANLDQRFTTAPELAEALCAYVDPEALDRAQGLKVVTGPRRTGPLFDARQSDPNLMPFGPASQPGFPVSQQVPSVPQAIITPAQPFPVQALHGTVNGMRGSDPGAVSYGANGFVDGTMRIPKRSGVVFALAALVAATCAFGLAFVAFRHAEPKSAAGATETHPQDPPTRTAETAAPPVTAAPLPTAPASTIARPAIANARGPRAPAPPSPPHVIPPTATPTPPPVTPPPTPTPKAEKADQKSDVF